MMRLASSCLRQTLRILESYIKLVTLLLRTRILPIRAKWVTESSLSLVFRSAL